MEPIRKNVLLFSYDGLKKLLDDFYGSSEVEIDWNKGNTYFYRPSVVKANGYDAGFTIDDFNNYICEKYGVKPAIWLSTDGDQSFSDNGLYWFMAICES